MANKSDILAELPTFRPAIEKALDQFAQVSPDRWFREVLVCLLTPQSSPFRAEQAITSLESTGFFAGSLTVAEVSMILRNPTSYVRFHQVKAERLLRALALRSDIDELLGAGFCPIKEREELYRLVNGLGMKEASHALRNIGRRGLTILDRHILRVLVEMGRLDSLPRSITVKRYIEIEQSFIKLSEELGESPDVLDLFFWARATGSVFK